MATQSSTVVSVMSIRWGRRRSGADETDDHRTERRYSDRLKAALLSYMFILCTQTSSASLASTGAVASVACLMVRLVVHVEELTGQGSIKSRQKVPFIRSNPL